MSIDRREIFRLLDPPAGGAERFARRLDEVAAETVRPRRGSIVVFGVAACAALALLSAIVVHDVRPPMPPPIATDEPALAIYDSPSLDRLLGRPPRTSELMVVLNDETVSVTEIETRNAKVRLYQIN